MKKFKKLFVIMLALPLALLISGCPGPDQDPDEPDPIITDGPYTITVENGTIEATADEDGKYPHNSAIRLIAENRSASYELFVSWTLDGEVVSRATTYSFRADKDGHYIANFEPDPNAVRPRLEPGDPGYMARTDLYRFYDDFSKGDAANPQWLDSTKWGYDERGTGFGNDEIQYYHRDNIRFVDCEETPGNRILVITMRREQRSNEGLGEPGGNSRNFTSGKFWSRPITSPGTDGGRGDPGFASTYGKIETRVRMWNKLIEAGYHENTANMQGLWPAFWMMPANSLYGGWPRSGEIDIMEIRGRHPRQMNSTIHRRAGNSESNGQTWVSMGSSQRSPTGTSVITGEPLLASYEGGDFRYADIENGIPGGSTAGDWHVYCIEWDYDEEREPGEQIEFRYYVDDILTYTIRENHWRAYTNTGGFNGELPKPKPFDQDFYIIFNFALGGNFDGNRVPNGTGNRVPEDAAIFQEDAPPIEYEIDWVVWREIMPRDGEPGGIQKPIYPEQ